MWFLTLTVPHTAGDDLGATLDRVRDYWRRMQHGTRFREVRKTMGVQGSVRAFEVTWSEANGWHPHLHVLLFSRAMYVQPLVDCWRAVWQADGIGDQWVPRVSADVRRVKRGSGAASYLAKVEMAWGVGTELARSDLKRGKGLTPAQLLELASTGEYEAVHRWLEFEHATRGLRWIEWARGLRDKAALWQIEATTAGVELEGVNLGDQELTDVDAASAEVRELVVRRFGVPSSTWARARAKGMLGVLLWSLVCGQTDGFDVQVLPLLDVGPERALAPVGVHPD